MVTEVNESNFSEVTASGAAVVDFYASWCMPCRVVGGTLEKISADNPDISIGKCNIEDNPTLAEAFGVRNIPFLVYFKDGEAVDGVAGLQTEQQILDKINELK